MKSWTKRDLGKILIYKDKFNKKNQALIINYFPDFPGLLRLIEYPISLDSKISYFRLPKYQMKDNPDSLEAPRDWCYKERVSKQQLEEIERLIFE